MSAFEFSWKFFTYRKNSNRINISALIPMVGTAIGTAIIILTIAIMDGIEEDIFDSLKSFNGSTIEINHKSFDSNLKEITSILNENDISFSLFNERKVVFENNGEYKIINVRGLEDIDIFKKRFDQLEGLDPINQNGILLGKDLAYRLNAYSGDTITMFSPLDAKIVTGFVPSENFVVKSIYSTRLLDFDANYAFVSYKAIKDMFIHSGNKGIFIHTQLSQGIIEKILLIDNDIEIKQWNDQYKNLINAMMLEKIAYVSFGLLVILISAFSIISVMSFTVLQKITQIGILKTLGYENRELKKIFSNFGLITGVIGSLAGLILAHILIGIEESYSIIYQFLGSNPYLIFPLKKSLISNIGIPVFTTLLITLTSYIPARNIIKIDPVKSIGMLA